MSSTRRDVLLAVGHGWLLLMGVGLVAVGETSAIMFGSLLWIIAVLGSVTLVVERRLSRRRPDLELGTAPSGAAALVFPYSVASIVMSAVGTASLMVWCLVGALLAGRAGHPGGAWLLGLLGLGLAAPFVPLLRGKIVAGGLYVTSFGVELRREGVGWSVPWDDIDVVAPADDVVLGLHRPAARHDTTRFMWRRTPRGKADLLVVPGRHLAGGTAAVAMVVARGRAVPESRGMLAQAHVVDDINGLLRARATASATPAP
ncbi:hypothetical protein BKA08_001989 [Nocardioides marinisabuli]|uniref:Uncharacterized protein n=1 Tax=Nocardioides marinisabuli TaxID=419476 RepID=A0A7Y9F1Q5_9ACTN|nr:hypothetical protein [Nocardioides marinisabuli]NYD57751.1 hypothetical protein [Nocardioides marinisabuli]